MSDCRFGVSPVNYPDPDPEPLRIGIIRALNECTVRLFKATTRHNHKSSDMQSKMKSNDQELIQSDPISCPQSQKGNN